MKPRFRRPMLGIVVAGALLAGGAAYAGPAFADTAPAPSDSVSVSPSDTTSVAPSDSTGPSDSASPSVSPSASPSDSVSPSVAPSDSTSPSASASDSTSPSASASVSPSPSDSTTPPPVETKAPYGYFVPNAWTLLYGQTLTLSLQGTSDNRLVDWGDGSTTSVTSAATSVSHKYPHIGNFPISETLSNVGSASYTYHSAGVAVINPAHIWITKKGVWQNGTVGFDILAVPAGVTQIGINFGDGHAWVGSASTKVVYHKYWTDPRTGDLVSGYQPIIAYFWNKMGESAGINIGSVNVWADHTLPVVSVTTPSSSTHASSWSYIHGTSADAQSGLYSTHVIVGKFTSTTGYCYTTSHTWKRIYSQYTDISACYLPVSVSGGKWTVHVTGLSKGYEVDVLAYAYDNVGNYNYNEVYKYLSY